MSYLLLLLTSSGVLASSLVMAVLRYFDYPTTASFTVDYRRNATFPAITVCNNNQVNVCVQSQTGHALAQGQRNQGQPEFTSGPWDPTVHKKWHCLVPHWLRFPFFLQYSCMTSFAKLTFLNALRFPKTQDQGKSKTAWLYKQSLIPWYQ